jgi:UTP--glucose-1-phosphate uridylyltransferase
MLTIVDKPLIQYAVDEAREAGIEQMIFVTGRGKSSLVDYFDVAFELETTMSEKGKSLDCLAPSRGRFGEVVSVRQQQPLGLGHAVWCARHVVGDEPFAVLLADDLMVGKPGALKQMVDSWERVGGNLVATEEVPAEKTSSYGIITPGGTDGDLTEVRGLVEKPAPEVAPSRLGVIGRYILQPDVMRVLDKGERGAGGEIQLTDAMAKLIGRQPFHALKVDAVRHDCGDRAGFVIANVAMAFDRPDVAPKVTEFLKERLSSRT